MNAEISKLYLEEGINPFSSLLPAFIQIPIFIALYQSILQLSKSDTHFQEGFLWVPTLAGPNPDGEVGLGWLMHLNDGLAGHENDMYFYFIVPFLLVASQTLGQKLSMAPTKQENFLTKLIATLPWFSFFTALSSPAGIGIYWFTNSILSITQSVFVKNKLKKEGLDMKQLALNIAEARANPNRDSDRLTK